MSRPDDIATPISIDTQGARVHPSSSPALTDRSSWLSRGRYGLLAVIVAVLAVASPASAALHRSHLSSFTAGGSQALTVDQASGDVYAVSPGAGTVSRFTAAGAPDDFSAGSDAGTNALTGFSFDGPSAAQVAVVPAGAAGGTAGDIYVVSFAGIDVFANDGTHLGQITQANGAGFTESCGVAVDPAGNLYVGDYGGNVDRYVPSGHPVTNADYDAQITGVTSPCAIAADSTGAVYASTYPTGPLTKYAAADFGTANLGTQIDATSTAVSIDPTTDDVYVDEGNQIAVFDATGAALYGFGSSTEVGPNSRGVAVAGGNGNAYVADDGHPQIAVYGPTVLYPDVTTGTADNLTASTATVHGTINPDGINVTDCHFDYAKDTDFTANGFSTASTAPCAETVGSGTSDVAVHADLSGLSPGSLYHVRLLATNANGTNTGPDHTFTTLAPVVSGASATHITTTDARLGAGVNPAGRPTTYHFDYGTSTSYGLSTPESPAGADASEHSVGRTVSALTPGTTYHFRVVATNSDGTSQGSDATFTTYRQSSTFEACPNDELRTDAGARLPDCRAYEQASSVSKNGTDVSGAPDEIQASSAGDGVTFYSNGGIPGGVGAQDFPFFLAHRDTSGWSTAGLDPPASYGSRVFMNGWTPDLSLVLTEASTNLTSDSGFNTTVLARSTDGSITTILPRTFGGHGVLAGASSDDSKVYFESNRAPLTPGAVPGVQNLYVWDRDSNDISLVGVLPDTACSAAPCPSPSGSFAGSFAWFAGTDAYALSYGGVENKYYSQDHHTISADGRRAFFTAGGTGQIYLRKDAAGPAPSTVQVSAPHAATADPNGPKPAIFMTATPSGSRAFFESCEKLTDDSTAVSTGADACDNADQGQDLYAYDTGDDELTDLTVDHHGDPHGAQVRGVLGASDDGSYVYFVANGVLAPDAAPGDCQGTQYGSGQCNLYLSHDGATKFVARLEADGSFFTSDATNWKPTVNVQPFYTQATARVSADGHTLLFRSHRRLTSYDNNGPCDYLVAGCAELFRYNTDDGLLCVSCDPTGAPPTDNVSEQNVAPPGPTQADTAGINLTRNLSSDGNRVFFDSPDRLVAGDIDGLAGCSRYSDNDVATSCNDVYMWEAKDSGSCRADDVNGGCLYLLSSGTGSDPSFFADASASGDDAFIFTRDQLVPQDQDGLQDIYDVKVGGGLAAQHPFSSPPCTEDTCQGSPTAPAVLPVAGSVTFTGTGNAPSRPGGSATVKPKVSGSRTVRGSSAALSIKVPSRGRLTVSGTGLRTVSTAAAKAGTYKIRVGLSAKARRAWQRAHVLRIRAKVVFAPSSGAPATATVTLTFRTATTTKKGR